MLPCLEAVPGIRGRLVMSEAGGTRLIPRKL